MKGIAFIFAVLITFLTVQPVCASLVSRQPHCEKMATCCKHESKKKSNTGSVDPATCCGKGVCNPFLACCYFTGIKPASLLPCTFFSEEKLASADEKIYSDYTFTFWHPPEAINLI